MKVLSLFDGMACGMIAAKNAGLQIDSYDAYEIDKYAIQSATHNFPEIKEHGDVFEADFSQYTDIDFIWGGSPCFTKGHLILTDKGYKDVSEIVVGDKVLTHKNRFMSVTRVYTHEADTTKLVIQSYEDFITTSNHPFYALTRSKATQEEYKQTHSWRKFTKEPEWVRVQDMTKDTFCGSLIHDSKNINEFCLTAEECYILGRYVADGHIKVGKKANGEEGRHYQLVLSIGEKKLNDFRSRVTENHFSCYLHSHSVYRCAFSSKRLVQLAENFGKGASNKLIPQFVFDLPNDLIEDFIAGYISGDGHYDEKSGQFTASTVSKELAYGLQRLISSHYKVTVGVKKHDNNRPHFIEGRVIKSNYPLYNIFFRKEAKKQSVFHIQNNIVWTNVKQVEPTGQRETVYNIEVEEDHSYTVNNCIVHNCTYWSIAQKNNRETEASGIGWELFSQYVRALKEVKPKYFIYENNKSMSKAIRDSIRETFGFEEICINSALVSAQNRNRFYWVGKYNPETDWYDKVDVKQPEDRGILLKDILNNGVAWQDKSYAYTTKCQGAVIGDTLKRHRHTMVAEPVLPVNEDDNGKARTLTASYYKYAASDSFKKANPRMGVAEPVNYELLNYEPRKNSHIVVADNSIRCAQDKNNASCGESFVEFTDKKSMTLIAARPNKIIDYMDKYAEACEWDENGTPLKATSFTDGKVYTVYCVSEGKITIKGEIHSIRLPDGYYIIRKLTLNECMRLQTVPSWYEFPVSNSQALKQLGNGWTCDIITHLIVSCLESN